LRRSTRANVIALGSVLSLAACARVITPDEDVAVTDAAERPDAAVIDRDAGVDGGPTLDAGASCSGLTPVTVETYCRARAESVVAHLVRCGVLGTAGAAEMLHEESVSCDATNLALGVAAGTVVFDGARAACCNAHYASDVDCFSGPEHGDPACDDVVGTLPLGAACTRSEDCRDGYCQVGASCPGTCVAYAAPGQRCDVGAAICDPTSNCDTGCWNSTNVCMRRTGIEGAACHPVAGEGCAQGLLCDAINRVTSAPIGTCRAIPTRGADCSASYALWCDLQTSICAYDFATHTGTCVAPLTTGDTRCIVDDHCAGDAYCRGGDYWHSGYGTCTPRALRGESCAIDECVAGLDCLAGLVCGDLPTVDGACIVSSGCRDAICNGEGVCVPLHAEGEPCLTNADCASANCRPDTLTCAPLCAR
jgi:hypothetical protein